MGLGREGRIELGSRKLERRQGGEDVLGPSILGDPQCQEPARTLRERCGVLILWAREAETTEKERTGLREALRVEQVGLNEPCVPAP